METSVPGGDDPQADLVESALGRPRPDTFVIRLASGAEGGLVGVIHHVRTGARCRFEGLHALGEAIRAMSREEQPS